VPAVAGRDLVEARFGGAPDGTPPVGRSYCSCVVPGREVAPGPGRSAAPSTGALNDGGMQKTVTRVRFCTVPSRQPGLTPVSVTVFAVPAEATNAPSSR